MADTRKVPGAPEPKKDAVVLQLATKATTEEKQIPLKDFFLEDEVFCLRPAAEFQKTALQALMESLIQEGLQTPVEAFLNDKGQYVPTKGHRRLTSMRLLANENQPGFKPDMQVRTYVVKDATPEDLFLRAVLDNETRKNFGPIERMLIAKKFHDKGVPVQRAASALGVGVKQYQRDLLVVNHPWMYELVLDNCIVPTTAANLLEIAVREKRVAELKADLTDWVADAKRKIADRERLRRLKGRAELRPAERLVRTTMTRDLVRHWVKQLKNKESFDKEVDWDFDAAIDAGSNRLKVESLHVDLATEPLDHVAKIFSRLTYVRKGVMKYLKRRHALEAAQGTEDPTREEAEFPHDVADLRAEGMDDLADKIELGWLEEPEQASGTEGADEQETTDDNSTDATEGI